MHRFRIVNVFAGSDPFTGNPLAVGEFVASFAHRAIPCYTAVPEHSCDSRACSTNSHWGWLPCDPGSTSSVAGTTRWCSPTPSSDGNPPPVVDFRRVYATVLERWWGLDSRGILGGRFEALPILRA